MDTRYGLFNKVMSWRDDHTVNCSNHARLPCLWAEKQLPEQRETCRYDLRKESLRLYYRGSGHTDVMGKSTFFLQMRDFSCT
jgi:hypothetical protein